MRSPLNSNEPLPVAVIAAGGISCPPFRVAVKCIWAGMTGGIIVSQSRVRERRGVRFNAASSISGVTGILRAMDGSNEIQARTLYSDNSREAGFVLDLPGEYNSVGARFRFGLRHKCRREGGEGHPESLV